MPATPRQIEITAADIESAKRTERDYDYNDIEVPGDYPALLVDVNDHKSENGESWKFTLHILDCPFDEYTSFSKKARWKLIQVMEALGHPVEEGVESFDPNAYIGSYVGAHVDWQHDPEDYDGPNYREIKYLYPFDEADFAEFFEAAADEDVAEEEPAVI